MRTIQQYIDETKGRRYYLLRDPDAKFTKNHLNSREIRRWGEKAHFKIYIIKPIHIIIPKN